MRAIVPGGMEESKMFVSLEEALSRYPKDRYEIIIGSAEAVDTDAKTVKVAVAGAGEPRTLTYDQLALATGSRNATPALDAAPAPDAASPVTPWKADGSYEDIKALLASTRDKVAAAKHIVVAGGGGTGVEVAAELGTAFGTAKEIVLLSASPELLGGDSAVAGAACTELTKLHVDVRTNSAVKGARTLPDGRVELAVAGAAEPLVTDLYLGTVGLTPNTGYLDSKLVVPDKKTVEVDEFYHVTAVPSHDVWAVGDVVSKPRAGFMITQKQAAGVGRNIDLALKGKPPQVVKLLPVDIMAVAIGPNRGVGRLNSFRLPSLAIWLAKARTLGTQMLPSYLDGSVA